MPLQSDGHDRYTLGLKFFQKRDCAFAFGFIFERIIVVAQNGVGVRFVRVLERFGNVILADDFHPGRLTQGAIFV